MCVTRGKVVCFTEPRSYTEHELILECFVSDVVSNTIKNALSQREDKRGTTKKYISAVAVEFK